MKAPVISPATANFGSLNVANSILRLPAVRERTGLGTTTIYERMNRGEFPQSISLGGRMRGWVSSEIEAYVRQCIEQSRKAA